ncbi:hypothetical protein EVAR_83198_1 [Eumeta japonica]|uniref:Uncharacterized protein n=1 Tax=Eumeta variegata TaxID=151549 RepID=A0A4C1YRZ7_EUMVA|nr:hypothetical protein EVAR_83198_1 [Eumeta japonica]
MGSVPLRGNPGPSHGLIPAPATVAGCRGLATTPMHMHNEVHGYASPIKIDPLLVSTKRPGQKPFKVNVMRDVVCSSTGDAHLDTH